MTRYKEEYIYAIMLCNHMHEVGEKKLFLKEGPGGSRRGQRWCILKEGPGGSRRGRVV